MKVSKLGVPAVLVLFGSLLPPAPAVSAAPEPTTATSSVDGSGADPSFGTNTSSPGDPLPNNPISQTGNDPQAEAYAKEFDIEYGEALKRLHAREAFYATFARSSPAIDYVELKHDPFTFIVASVDGNLKMPQDIEGYPVVQTTSKIRHDDLVAVADRLAGILRAAKVIFETTADDRTAVVTVNYAGDLPTSLKGKLESSIGNPAVSLEMNSVPLQQLPQPAARRFRGGDLQVGTQYACTTSWATRDSDGEVTMMSAGHCDNSGTYQGVTLQYKGEFYFTNYDWQLWRGSGMDIRARFYDGSQYQPVLGYSPGVPAYNDLVCKYGRTLGARCGRVISTIEAPSYVPNATNTFIKVHSDAYAVTAGGDSGGPVYVGRIAFGLISGVVNSNGDMIYNRAGYLFDNGKRILIANDLTSGETINPDLLNYRIAFNSQYKLTMQPDGNLVLYKNNGAIWATSFYSGFQGVSGSRVAMQSDGNLVVYSPNNTPTWAASWYGLSPVGASELLVQDDGNMVIYTASGSPRWATYTS